MVGEKTVTAGTQETRQKVELQGGRTLLEKGKKFFFKDTLYRLGEQVIFSHKEKLEHREREGGGRLGLQRLGLLFLFSR